MGDKKNGIKMNMRIGSKLFLRRIVQSGLKLVHDNDIEFSDIWPKIDAVEGLLVKGQEKWLFGTARSLPDGARILEIGGYKGRSTVCLAYGCVGSLRHVFTIDRFKGIYKDVEGKEDLEEVFVKGFFDEWKANIEANGLENYVTAFACNSLEFARYWRSDIHMLFIDGSHEYEDILNDFLNFFPFVVREGIIAIHDVTANWQGPYRAWHENIKKLLINTGSVSTLAYGRKK
jgi:hypothetical protein